MLIVHLFVALASLVATGLALFAPSGKRLHISYALISLTLLSGTILVVQTHAPLLSSCETGLIYLAFALSGIAVARHRLSSVES